MRKQIKPAKRNTSADTTLFREIRELILSARNTVVRNVDTIQVVTNFEIGRRIVNYEQGGKTRAEYGEKTLVGLSQKLTQEFGRGFSMANLKLMRQFFIMYRNLIGQTVSDQLQKTQIPSSQSPKSELLFRRFTLSWSHYVFLLGIGNISERNFYEIEAAEQNWSLRELKRQFNSSLYA